MENKFRRLCCKEISSGKNLLLNDTSVNSFHSDWNVFYSYGSLPCWRIAAEKIIYLTFSEMLYEAEKIEV